MESRGSLMNSEEFTSVVRQT